jgi:Transglutaminase-like superfamily
MKIFLSTLLASAIVLSSCHSGNRHLISNSKYLAATEKAFDKRKLLAQNRDSELFSVFNKNLSVRQSEALKFLFAYMPLNDLADYNGSFFLANADIALRAQSETKWGKDIPEELFLHYVLPYRINNENLDSFRIACYQELFNRVKGMDMSEAALEVNHWCHEKVSYQPSDIRTSAPLSTILSAQGRCGEESTFTVAALRTVGIPARQVYTPRWAHTDDNHAWVEIWINGQWYYMGACEPEPVLDRGWFTEPARRAMLVHTKSFGAFSGNENVIQQYPDFTDVNNLAKYAVTKKISVKVTDSKNLPVANALVEYQLYNYAEFYPLAVVPTDENGISQFETGLGDLVIWAHKDNNYDYKKISVAETDTLILKLGVKNSSGSSGEDLDLDVPVLRTPLPGPSQEIIEKNAVRITLENSIRQKYIDSWIKPEEITSLARKLNLDTSQTLHEIRRSMGNYKEIISFLSGAPDSLRDMALSLLEILPDKDLRDSRASVLSDHLKNAFYTSRSIYDNKMFMDYVLNPRVANEMLVPWRHYILSRLSSGLLKDAGRDPSSIIGYLNENIKIDDEDNYYQTPLTPIGVIELKLSDKISRAICFVAICRTLGIPSRLEPGRNEPQYFSDNKWIDVYFKDQKPPDSHKGFIRLLSSDTKPVPEYYIHFTLARFEDGRYNTLEYDYNKKITDFTDELALPPGSYMLVTGNRISDNKILANISFFDLAEKEHRKVIVKLRRDISENRILGTLSLNSIDSLILHNGNSQACSNNKGIVIVWLDPEKEPSKHIINDLPLLKKELDSWGGKFLFLSDKAGNDNTLNTIPLSGLPANSAFASDDHLTMLKQAVKLDHPSEISLPAVLVSDSHGNILFFSNGYRIGIGEQILKYCNKEK